MKFDTFFAGGLASAPERARRAEVAGYDGGLHRGVADPRARGTAP
jgi:hypothetical protein